jgi:hypothetical protein
MTVKSLNDGKYIEILGKHAAGDGTSSDICYSGPSNNQRRAKQNNSGMTALDQCTSKEQQSRTIQA